MQTKLKVHLMGGDGSNIQIEVDKHTVSGAAILTRNGRFYTYGGAYQGNYYELKFHEVTQPVHV